MFIGEAPGRLGANETAIPFHGDQSAGDNFEQLLSRAEISRYDCFITNAAPLCNPRDENGNNATPNRQEVLNCSHFLKTQIRLADPVIIVTLGGLALSSLKNIEPHGYNLSTHVRKCLAWSGRHLIPLYHPGQRAMVHRSFLNQLSDYRFVAEQLRRLSDPRVVKISFAPSRSDVAQIATTIIRLCGEISYFRLHKLFYLAEYHYSRETGNRISSSYVIRQKDGPYFTELHVRKLKRAIPNLKIARRGDTLVLSLIWGSDLFDPKIDCTNPLTRFIDSVVRRYESYFDARIKSAVYMTAPMRKLIRREKYGGVNLLNAPIVFPTVGSRNA